MSTEYQPTVEQISMASERPILAVLEMTVRTLVAEHPLLEEDAARGSAEPPPAHRTLAASTIILATSLRNVVANYLDLITRRMRS